MGKSNSFLREPQKATMNHRDWQPGDKVASIAVNYLGIGKVEQVRMDHIIVRWPDKSWSKERPQDLIFGGDSETPTFAAEGFDYISFPMEQLREVKTNTTPNVLRENITIYERLDREALVPGAPVPMIAKGVVL
jgi:hypothetical protein|tara:strand:- start:32 stop:433 length:402 start_codon:yes stop_codon:yes gene_type:complete